MGELTQQQQDLATKTLFGSSAAQVMLSIVRRGPAAFDAATAAAQKQGTAAKAAALQNQTFGKQLDILKATVENAFTSNGMGILPVLTDVTKGVESAVQWFEKGSTAARGLEIVVGGVLATALTVFAYQKATAFVTGVKDMAGGIGQFLGVTTPAVSETEALTAAVQELTGSLAAVAPEADADATAIASMGTAEDGAAGGAARLATANDVAAASFTKMIPIIGAAVIALEGYNAIASNPQAAGVKAVHGLQSASGHALSQGQLSGLLASTGAVGLTGKHGLFPWSEDDTSLIQSADKALKSFAGSGNQSLLDGITKRAEALRKEWPQNAAELNTLISVMAKARSEGAAVLSSASSGTGSGIWDLTKAQEFGALPNQPGGASVRVPTSSPPPPGSLSLLQPGTVQAAAATLQTTQVTDQTQIITDAATAQTTIIKDQQTLQSNAMQAAVKNVSDSANVMAAKITAAATAITDASTVSQDKSSAIVTGMQDVTQIEADKLGERLLYGYELQAQRDQVQ